MHKDRNAVGGLKHKRSWETTLDVGLLLFNSRRITFKINNWRRIYACTAVRTETVLVVLIRSLACSAFFMHGSNQGLPTKNIFRQSAVLPFCPLVSKLVMLMLMLMIDLSQGHRRDNVSNNSTRSKEGMSLR